MTQGDSLIMSKAYQIRFSQNISDAVSKKLLVAQNPPREFRRLNDFISVSLYNIQIFRRKNSSRSTVYAEFSVILLRMELCSPLGYSQPLADLFQR